MNSKMTKQEKIKILQKQFKTITEDLVEKEPWIYNSLEPAISEMYGMLLTPDSITKERLEKYKDILHLLDTVIAGMDTHAEIDIPSNATIWAYLYSLSDTLEWLYEDKGIEGAENE